MPESQSKHQALRARLSAGQTIVAPGVYDLISARIADRMGFGAIYMTGFGVAASYLGMPDAGLATFTDMVGRVRQIADRTATPLIADADTGFGGLANVQATVRGYESAGASAIQLEDQEMPKKCGHVPGRQVIPAEEMVLKIQAATEARSNPDFMIIARTDARTAHGLDEAMRRAESYAEAGADILFVESPESEAELETIGRAFDLPLVANMVEGGRTPVLSPEALARLGFRIILHPALGFLATAAALENAYGALGAGKTVDQPLYDFELMNKLMGFEDIWSLERRFAQTADHEAPAR